MKNKIKLIDKRNLLLKLFFITTIVSFYCNSFCMEKNDKTFQLTSEQVNQELKFFWGENAPWPKHAYGTVICLVNLLQKVLDKRYCIETYEHTFTSELYLVGACYLKDKFYLKDNTNKDKILLKSFEDQDDKVDITFDNGKTCFFSKKTNKLHIDS